MSNLPPFDPPFYPISADYALAMSAFDKSGRKPDGAKTADGAVSGNAAALFFLVVAFAEKDEVKSLGARWDAKARKWYVPQGKDRSLFKRWHPAQ